LKKNVSGRLLVGLRWWNRINEDGTNEWVFESLEDMSEIDPLDAKVFWTGLYGAPAVWALLFVVGLLKFNVEWALIAIVALMLSGANIVGYTKCSKGNILACIYFILYIHVKMTQDNIVDAKEKMRSMMSAGAFQALNSGAGSTILSHIGGLAFNATNSSRPKPSNNPNITV